MKASVYLFKRAVKNAQLANNTWYPNKHNALVEFDDKRQSLVVTVMSVYGQVSTFVPVSVFDGGSINITVDARQLSKVARQLTGNIVKVEQSKDGLILSDEKASYLILPSDSPVAKPEYSEIEIPYGFVIEDVKSFLREMQCSEQCSGSVLGSLRCVYVRLSDHDQTIVVTGLDNFRIREKTLDAKVMGRGIFPIDKDDAKMIAGAFKGEDVISVKASKTTMILESQTVKVICKLMEVEMPNYFPYFEDKCVAFYNVVANARQLHEVAKRLANFGAIMEIDFSERNFLKLITDPHHFAGFERVPYAVGDPPFFPMLVNTRYFADVLDGLEGNVKIEIGANHLSPVVVRADGYRAILMPMKRANDGEDENEE